ncbi:MAG: Gfo/Idh/MocA family oxidoreductase [Fimbriimonadaceae bacterium]|nr:Gfo/Idh/MocA family oxidoreductase [Fimbriimonadaceae bacterium]
MKVEAALLGCDHPHAASHLTTLQTMPEVSGIHLWDPDPAVAEALAAKVGPKLRAVHQHLDSVRSEAAVPWAIAGLRHDRHAELLLRWAEAGKSVLSEKPIGLNSAEVRPVVAAYRQRGLSLSVLYTNRFKPAVGLLREAVAKGWLGRLCSAETRLHTTTVGLRNPRHWLFNKALSGGGILPWLGCHYLDLLRYILGSEVVSVTAHCATLSGEAIDVEDMAVLTLRFANGCLATASFGYLMPGGSGGNSFASKDTWLGLKGTLGSASFAPTDDPQVVDLVTFHPDWVGAPERRVSFREEVVPAYGDRPGLEFAQQALRAALAGEDGPATGEDMLRTWEIIEAAWESAERGVTVALAG